MGPRFAARRGEGGQSAVELALILPVLLLLVVTAIDLGRAYYSYTGMASAVRVGAAYATTQARSLDAGYSVAERKTIITNIIVQESHLVPALTAGNITISGNTMNQWDSAYIEATYPFQFITPLARALVGGDGKLHLRYRVTIAYT